MTDDQDVIRVQTPGGVATFPAGTDPGVMEQALREQFQAPSISEQVHARYPYLKKVEEIGRAHV